MNGKQAKFLRSIKATKRFKKKYKAWPHYLRGGYRAMMDISPEETPFTGRFRPTAERLREISEKGASLLENATDEQVVSFIEQEVNSYSTPSIETHNKVV